MSLVKSLTTVVVVGVVGIVAAGCGSKTSSGSRVVSSAEAGVSASGGSAPPIVKGEWGKPVDVDGRFVITVSAPVDVSDRFPCEGGPCGRTGVVDVTVTAGRDAVVLSGAFSFTGVDENFSEVGVTWAAMVGDVVLPVGATHVERGVQLHYGDEARSGALTLWLVDPVGVPLVEWVFAG